MAIAVHFTPKTMNADQYETILKELGNVGADALPGCIYHICFGSGNHLQVLDVWESKYTFEKFEKFLTPILKQLHIDSGEPHINEVYNTMQGRVEVSS